MALQLPELVAQKTDARANGAAVELQFLLARSPGADTAAEAGERAVHAEKMCLGIVELREFHLQLALGRDRVLRKNIEDNHRAVHDLDTERLA